MLICPIIVATASSAQLKKKKHLCFLRHDESIILPWLVSLHTAFILSHFLTTVKLKRRVREKIRDTEYSN